MRFKTLTGILLFGFLLLACEPTNQYGGPIDCPRPATMVLDVVILDTVEDVERVYLNVAKTQGIKVNREGTRDAFCVLRSNNTRTCYLPKLRGQRDDDRMLLWGHEFSHVVCGDWHDEDFVWTKE